MSEKKIKGIVVGKYSGNYLIGAEEKLPIGSGVEIVYRDEVEIRPGQRWRIEGQPEDQQHLAMVIRGCQAWYLASMHGYMLSHLGIDRASKAELQSWLNEHATLEEGES